MLYKPLLHHWTIGYVQTSLHHISISANVCYGGFHHSLYPCDLKPLQLPTTTPSAVD